MDVDDISSFELMYMAGKGGLIGNNESMLDFHQPTNHHHNHPVFNGGANRNVSGGAAVDDPGGMEFDYGNGTWSNCVTIDHSLTQPTTAFIQFVVNGLGISIVAVLGKQNHFFTFEKKCMAS